MLSAKSLEATLSTVRPLDGADAVNAAKAVYASFRAEQGFVERYSKLLTDPSENVKLQKSGKGSKVATYGLSLSPANLSGVVNVCPWSTKGCRDLCLNTAGKGDLDSVQKGRKVKTMFLVAHPAEFLTLLAYEIDLAWKREARKGVKLGMRLNVLSDIRWEIATPWMFGRFADVQFYDYTKANGRETPRNYHLTYSASERWTDENIVQVVEAGDNVTVIADKVNGAVPTTFYGLEVVDGDKSDYRPADKRGVVVFLTPKGRARKAERGGFVRTAAGLA